MKNFYQIKQKGLKTTALQEDGHKLSEIAIEKLVPGLYNNVRIKIQDGRHILDLPAEMDAPRFRFWKKTAAGIFSRDLLRLTRAKAVGNWILVEGKVTTTVLRLIADSEFEEFDALKLVHGKIKDTYYMHLKTVSSKRNINWDTGYIKQIENELTYFEQEQLELELAMEEESTGGVKTKPKKEAPKKPGPLFN